MGVKYVIVEPDPPGWWARNKFKTVVVLAVAAVFYLHGRDGQPADNPQPRPTPNPSASTSRSAVP
ncbi:hypothetical protein ABT368_31840 [Streptomyces althioticus]|uniref:hypothetical protein n=1 Tax=Streptomyces althioticus TaxID=83380 RepID=UPI00137C5963|nr:hypothetical protein [Streptomyces sp. SID6013]GGT78839.1 hypothetical protein GCM10010243_66600 [Streptomyces matensis]